MKKLVVLLMAVYSTFGLCQSYENGEQIFSMNCVACHKMDEALVGPKLNNVVKLQGEDWVKAWINNNVELRESGDKHAKEVYEQYGKQAMPVYAGVISEEELDDLVFYLEKWDETQEELADAEAAVEPTQVIADGSILELKVELEKTVKIIIALCFIALLLAVWFLYNSFKLMSSMYFKGRILQTYLLRKLDMSADEAETELNDYIKGQVDQDVDLKKKELKKLFNEKLDTIGIEKKEEENWVNWLQKR